VDAITYIPPIAGVIGLVAAVVMYRAMMRYPAMEGAPTQIASMIRAGAKTFMRRELQLIAIAVAVLAVALGVSPLGWVAIALLIPGDAVITTPLTHRATADAIEHTGA
jgi:K(+)-stimulated pyrophosphate-energized sodium pump